MGDLERPRAERPETKAASPQRPADQSFDARSELNALRRQVRDQAYQEGRQAGFEAGQEQGYTQGLEQGRHDGEQQAREQAAASLAPLAELATQFQNAIQTLDRQIADDLVDLALAVGKQLAGEALTARPEQVLALVRELLHQEPQLGADPRLWLHPDDLVLVEEHLATELTAAGWQVRVDPDLQRGGCRVTGDAGERDASRACRWDMLLAKLRRQPRETET
ncbi:flagellar assembly protein FliH [Alcanivorax xiamenensis]|uniref:Flagellar assembly protein FliH n=2 Tax=Alcanivoracaceae TaxID=224372 RepID=A0ABQ6Y4E1_9GAMM|nr:flagellar assembly protein FliH [Alcanivorax xiamenensis]